MRPTQGRMGSIQPTVATPIQPVEAMDTQHTEPMGIPTATVVVWSSEVATMAVDIMAVATREAIGAEAIEVEIRRVAIGRDIREVATGPEIRRVAIQRDIRWAAIDRRAREALVIER